MEEVIEAILVRNAKGDELIVYEYQDFVPHLTSVGLSRAAAHKRFALETGETVTRVDHDMFVISATGERLSKIS